MTPFEIAVLVLVVMAALPVVFVLFLFLLTVLLWVLEVLVRGLDAVWRRRRPGYRGR